MIRCRFPLLLASLVTVAAAAPAPRDLGEGLAYFRVHALPADLPAPDAKPGATVLDLRFVDGAPEDVAVLQAWLRFHATAATPVFVLINAKTGAAIRDVVSRLGASPGLLTIGPDLPDHEPDLVVKTTPAAERKAYDALDQGTSAEALITENADKPRHDEAALAAAPTTADDNDDTAATANDQDDDADAAPAAPPLDVALQRAVQVDRALLALGRLPARG